MNEPSYDDGNQIQIPNKKYSGHTHAPSSKLNYRKRTYKRSFNQLYTGKSLEPEINSRNDNNRLCSNTTGRDRKSRDINGQCSLELRNIYINKRPIRVMTEENKTNIQTGKMNINEKYVSEGHGRLCSEVYKKSNGLASYTKTTTRNNNNFIYIDKAINRKTIHNAHAKQLERHEPKIVCQDTFAKAESDRILCNSYKTRFFVGKPSGHKSTNPPLHNAMSQKESKYKFSDFNYVLQNSKYEKTSFIDSNDIAQSDSIVNDMHSYKNTINSRCDNHSNINKVNKNNLYQNFVENNKQKKEQDFNSETNSMKNNKMNISEKKKDLGNEAPIFEDTRDSNVTKGPWSKEEDERLIMLIKKYGPRNWSKIAENIKSRIGKQCRERWHNHLHPNIKKTPFTPEEDKVILRLHTKFGNRWSEISKFLPGRTDNAIKNHWNSGLQKRIRRRSYSAESMVCIKKFDDRCCCMECSDEREKQMHKRSMSSCDDRCVGIEEKRGTSLDLETTCQIFRRRSTELDDGNMENGHYGRKAVGPYKIIRKSNRNEYGRDKREPFFQGINTSEKHDVVKKFEKMSEAEKIASIALLELFNCM